MQSSIPENLFKLSESERQSNEELFQSLMSQGNVTIERIVSTGQSSPEGFHYDQEQDEWVAVLSGFAKLEIDGLGVREMHPGDFVFIPKRLKHRVAHTDNPTVWLAIHIHPQVDKPTDKINMD